MKKSIMKSIMKAAAVIILFGAVQGVRADEKTGREINEIVRDLNRGLTEAREKVERLEEERSQRSVRDSSEILPERAAALEKLEESSEALDEEEDPEARKSLADEVDRRVLEVAALSADFLENQKEDLLAEDEQMRVVETALAEAILKMERLHKLTCLADAAHDPEGKHETEVQARRELQNVAHMVEMLAPGSGNPKRWHSVRQTIALQNAILHRATVDNSPLYQILGRQKEVYEQALAQICTARQGIAAERELLAQISLGEVARSLVRKAARLLLGSTGISEIGAAAMAKSERRQQDVLAFLNQEEAAGPGSSNLGDYTDSSGQMPAGYAEFLNETIE